VANNTPSRPKLDMLPAVSDYIEALEDRKRLDWLQKQDSGTLKIAIYQNGHAEVNPNGKIANWYVGNSLREALDAARKGATEK